MNTLTIRDRFRGLSQAARSYWRQDEARTAHMRSFIADTFAGRSAPARPTPAVAAMMTERPKMVSPIAPMAAAVRAVASVDMAAIRAEARAAENKRVAEVFASEASIGRERTAAVLLAGGGGISAETIISVLAKTPSADQSAAASILASFARQPNPPLGSCAEIDPTPNPQETWRRAHAAVTRP